MVFMEEFKVGRMRAVRMAGKQRRNKGLSRAANTVPSTAING